MFSFRNRFLDQYKAFTCVKISIQKQRHLTKLRCRSQKLTRSCRLVGCDRKAFDVQADLPDTFSANIFGHMESDLTKYLFARMHFIVKIQVVESKKILFARYLET